jgi:hypothetical protein
VGNPIAPDPASRQGALDVVHANYQKRSGIEKFTTPLFQKPNNISQMSLPVQQLSDIQRRFAH